ncbi:MAG TPA: hypothetical protein VGX00_03150 [Thermoplasmata archaeon]|nr:hypothetical protein [Thermoplasmata archaeon]
MGLALREPGTGALRAVRGRPGRPVSIYVCGPTVYDDAHVGHARTYLVFDVARRQLEAQGRAVRHVMNITDFEDKVADRAVALGTRWDLLARRIERRFRADLDRLAILPAHRYPRASDHVPAMRTAVRALDRAHRLDPRDPLPVYRPGRPGSRGASAPSEASRHMVAEAGRSTPVGLDLGEFSLWLPPHPGGPGWPSPWGAGTPGWHLECYVMARRYLGLPVDLHGGGRDLAFPHHYAESELAGALDHCPFSRQYLYVEFVTQNGVKMAKSTGNLVSVRSAIAQASAPALRWYLLSVPYERPLEWDPRGLAMAERTLRSVRASLRGILRTVAGGTLQLGALLRLRDAVARDLARNLGTERALARIARFAEQVDAAPRGSFPRGSRPAVEGALRDVEQRIGIRLR